MSALQTSINLFEAERQVSLEKPKDANAVGDISGSVKATWLRLNESGLGEVEYNDKVYKTITQGSRSIARGTAVQLSFAKGVYFSNW